VGAGAPSGSSGATGGGAGILAAASLLTVDAGVAFWGAAGAAIALGAAVGALWRWRRRQRSSAEARRAAHVGARRQARRAGADKFQHLNPLQRARAK